MTYHFKVVISFVERTAPFMKGLWEMLAQLWLSYQASVWLSAGQPVVDPAPSGPSTTSGRNLQPALEGDVHKLSNYPYIEASFKDLVWSFNA